MHPLRKRDDAPQRKRTDQWKLRDKGLLTVAHDNPRICPPEIPGQMTLLRLPRAFSLDDGPRIRDRQVPDLETVREVITAVRCENRLSGSWQRCSTSMARLALAARDPDEQLVREEDLDQLPAQRRDLVEVFRRADLLRLRRSLPPTRLATRTQRQHWMQRRDPFPSCTHCLAWAGDAKTICELCRAWANGHPVGTCQRCRRRLPVKGNLCRFCHVVFAENPLQDNPIDQRWFGGDLAVQLYSRTLGRRFRHSRRRALQHQAAAAREVARPISTNLVDPDQLALVDLRRDWRRLDTAALPRPTKLAMDLLTEFDQHARSSSWLSETRRSSVRVLRILLAWLGPYAPIPEVDVHAVASMSRATTAARMIQYLASKNLLIPDPDRNADADEAAVNRLLATLPEEFVPEVQAWIRVLRGNGSKPPPVMPWQSIRRYLGYLAPILQGWGNHDSLRAITLQDIEAALQTVPAQSARSLNSAVRSLFRALRRERLIFRDPTRNISFPQVKKLPTPLPTDRLRGLLDTATSSAAKLAVALVAIHALYVEELRDLRLAQIDRSAGRMTLHRATCEHVVFLDELTRTLLDEWLRERFDRWPCSLNPHLFVSQQTAVDHRSLSRFSIVQMFAPLGITPRQLRIDRVLDEAHHTADPVHLMRVFGISDTTAMKYTRAAHPDRFVTGRTSP